MNDMKAEKTMKILCIRQLKYQIGTLSLSAATLLLTYGYTARAEQARGPDCTQSIKSTCTGKQTSERCLAIKYACGEYQQILGTLPQAELTANQLYFAGVAALAHSFMESTPSLFCSYSIKGQEYLESYLRVVHTEYNSQGTFGSSDELKRLNHAIKMLKRSQESDKECLRHGYSLAELKDYAKTYAKRLSTEAFLGNHEAKSTDDKKLYDPIIDIYTNIGSLVSMASSAESTAALAALEINAVMARLSEIEKKIESDYRSSISTSKKKMAIDKVEDNGTGSWKVAVKRLKENFESATNSKDFAQKKRDFVEVVIKEEQSAERRRAFASDYLDLNNDQQKFSKLLATIDANVKADDNSDYLGKTLNEWYDWAHRPGNSYCELKPNHWSCKNPKPQ